MWSENINQKEITEWVIVHDVKLGALKNVLQVCLIFIS
jgi:hypothetical protein